MFPSWMRSRNCRPRLVYFFASDITNRRLASIISLFARLVFASAIASFLVMCLSSVDVIPLFFSIALIYCSCLVIAVSYCSSPSFWFGYFSINSSYFRPSTRKRLIDEDAVLGNLTCSLNIFCICCDLALIFSCTLSMICRYSCIF